MTTHTKLSYFKSAVRIIGFTVLPFDIYLGCGILIGAELLGVIEEFNP